MLAYGTFLNPYFVRVMPTFGVKPSPWPVRIEFFGDKLTSTHEVSDNFSMFRRALWDFGTMIRTRQPVKGRRIGPDHKAQDRVGALLTEPVLAIESGLHSHLHISLSHQEQAAGCVSQNTVRKFRADMEEGQSGK